METKANYVAVGAFVMICILGLVVTLLWLAGVQYSQEFTYYQTSFKGPVTGLGKGTTVRYNGIDTGHVTDLEFDPNDPQMVIATMQIKPGLSIREDSEASIESEGLTGGSYVEISGGTKNSPLLQAPEGGGYPRIKSKPSSLQQLFQSAPELMAKLNVTADRVNELLNDKNRQAFSDILANVNKTTGALARRSGDIDTMLANFSRASKRLDPVLADTDVTVKKVGKLTVDMDEFVNGEGRSQLSTLLTETRGLVESLTRLSNELDRQPTKLLFGDRRKGYTPK
jgi:phospholipid/cholesterol/gamma-HCH transport system substrate-binding protein